MAAPLLAGFCFTLLVLVLPTIDSESRTVTPSGVEVTRTEPFSGAPELAAVLLLAAGVSLIGSVQTAITMRKHATTPSELEEWYPNYFREERDTGDDDDQFLADGRPKAMPSFWQTARGWKYRRVGTRWYGAEVRERLYAEVLKANGWALWTRRLYHTGIVALLAGVTASVWPPDAEWDAWRSVLVALAAAATVAECVWILLVSGPALKSARRSPGGRPSVAGAILIVGGWSMGLVSLLNPDETPFALLAMIGGVLLIAAGIGGGDAVADAGKRSALPSYRWVAGLLIAVGTLWIVFGVSSASS